MRKIVIVFLAPLFLILFISGCGSKSVIDNTAQPSNEQATSDSESLDARVEQYSQGDVAKGERVPGEVGVILKGGITEEEAYQIFASHGFERQSVEKQYTPQLYILHFSEGERDIKSLIRELLIDGNVESASTAKTTYSTLDY